MATKAKKDDKNTKEIEVSELNTTNSINAAYYHTFRCVAVC